MLGKQMRGRRHLLSVVAGSTEFGATAMAYSLAPASTEQE